MTKLHNSRTLKSRLLVCSALVGVSVALASGPANAQATVDIDFGTPTYALSADAGTMLPQFSAAAVSGTTSGTTGVMSMLSNSATDTDYTGAYLMENNALASEADGNTAGGTVNLTFTPGVGTDTAAAGVFQDVTASVAAEVTSSYHDIDFLNSDATGTASLTGTLNVENNDLLATAKGNTASSTISVASGVNLTGNGAQASTLTDSTYAAAIDSDNAADMLVAQAQRVSGNIAVSADTDDSDVMVDVEELSGATVTVSATNITAAATGSDLAGSITSADTTATIGASAAVVGVQSLEFGTEANDVVARNLNSDIIVRLGESGDGVVDDSTVTVSGNQINTVATGATADQSISLVANQITGNGTTASITDTAATAGVQLDADADALVASVQTMNGVTTVFSDNDDNVVLIDLEDMPDGTAADNSLLMTGNMVAAAAVGLDATNAATLEAGSTLSAPGAVASVQLIEGVVSARNRNNHIEINVSDNDYNVSGSTYVMSGNAMTATAVGGQVNNDLVVANTDILSVATNTGSAAILADPASGTEAEAPTVTAGYALSNDQRLSDGDVLANEAGLGYTLDFDEDTASSTIAADKNTVSAAATGALANNAISLSFNELTGGVVGNGDVVAAAANSQRVDSGSTVIASAYGDASPVYVYIDNDANSGTSISVSSNTVSAAAIANRSTGTTVTVDATNVVITGGIAGAAQVDKTSGDVTGSAAFVSVSSQELDGSTVTAHQVDSVGTPTGSNWIETAVEDNISGSTIVTNSNTLSVAATGNLAVTGVSTGTATTAQIQATSAAASYQDVASSAINAVLGSVGSDASAAYTSTNAPTNAGFAPGDVNEDGSSKFTNATGGNLTFTFANANAQEIAILSGTFGAGNVSTVGTTTTVTWNSGQQVDLSTYNVNILGTEFVNIITLTQVANAGTLNTAGVIIDAGDANSDHITDSTLTIDSNVIVGEVRGNVATNTVTATATTLTAWASAATPSTDTDATTVVASNADNALTNVQEIDGTSALTNTVAGTFALVDDNDSDRTGSSISVSDNLLQSYGTSNTASNTVTLTATNSSAGAALLNEQTMTAPTSSGVVTVSDMDVATHAAMTSSDQALDNNTNQSVASANVETSTVTVDVTNANPVTGTAADATYVNGTAVATADAILATEQDVTGTPTISASATTDVYNRDLGDTTADQIITSTLSMGGNQTLAQATGNNSTASMLLGDAGTATYDASGVIRGNQEVVSDTVISAVTDVEVGTQLQTADATNATLQSSTVSIDGNRADAIARGNVQSSTLTVTAANIDAGSAADADVDDTDSSSAFLLERYQSTGADVSANSSAAAFSLSATGGNSATEASDGSTLSVSSNVSSATATSNIGTNKVTIGSVAAASLQSTGALDSDQNAGSQGSAAATGGMSVSATFGTTVTDNTVVAGTTLNLNGNISSASATANSVTNTYTATATSMTAGAADTDASVALAGVANANDVTAANILSNVQRVAAGHTVTATNNANSVTASASTGVATTSATAINASTVSLADNAFSAYATGNSAGNSAANSMSLGGSGTSLLSVNAGVANRQQQDGAITASGSASVRVIADGAVGAGTSTALNASTVSVADNSVMVMARGNLANNSLSVGATSATGGAGTDGSTDGVSTTSTFGLLNHQNNNGAVSATSDSAGFQVALNTVASSYGTAASASSIGVSGNSVMAAAYGNVATNSNTLASLEGAADDATVVTASYQMASGGAITANVTNGFAGVSANGPVGTSTVAVRGNTFTSKAVGNFATSVVTRR